MLKGQVKGQDPICVYFTIVQLVANVTFLHAFSLYGYHLKPPSPRNGYHPTHTQPRNRCKVTMMIISDDYNDDDDSDDVHVVAV